MAECYSSSAPIHALASSILGESSFSSKNSRSHLPHLHQGFRSSLQHQFPADHKKHIDSDSFEQAWSSSGQSFKAEQDRFFFSNGPDLNYHPQKTHHLHRHLPDPDLIASWDHAVQSSANKGLWEQSAGLNSRPLPDFSTEFESFHCTTPSTQSEWASELEAQDRVDLKIAQTVEDEDDDDDEDEFREEWSNDYFTQAYINSHQSQFQKIQETEQLKEAKLQEERERLKRSTPSSYMASSTAVSGSYPARVTDFQARPRLRVPGLEPEEDERAMFSLDEYAQFNHVSDTQKSIQLPKPVHAQDRFLSLVSDLHIAGQIYYPGASLATLPNSMSDQELDTCTYNNGWAQEFAVETELSAKIQKHLGAEWSWEKLFGKNPRKAAERAQRQLEQQQQDYQTRQTGHVRVLTSKEQSEHDRLKAVALSRLQAVFCHLSLTTPPSSSTTPL